MARGGAGRVDVAARERRWLERRSDDGPYARWAGGVAPGAKGIAPHPWQGAPASAPTLVAVRRRRAATRAPAAAAGTKPRSVAPDIVRGP